METKEKPEIEKQEKIPEAEIDLFSVPIGEDKPQINAKKVVIENIRIQEVTRPKETLKKVVLEVKHPEVDRVIEITAAKYESGKTIKTAGLWYKLDKDYKLPYGSAIANLLRYVGKDCLGELKGEQVETVLDDNGYLVVKAY